MKNCTPSWREADLEVKSLKTPHVRSMEVEMLKKCTSLWREAHFEVKMVKTPHVRSTWKLRCSKSAWHCGAKHISKSKCSKHLSVGALLEVEIFKKCTSMWREAHFEIKNVKPWRSWSTLKLRCRKSARHCGAKHMAKRTQCPGHFWTLNCTTRPQQQQQQQQLQQLLQLQQQQLLLLLLLQVVPGQAGGGSFTIRKSKLAVATMAISHVS